MPEEKEISKESHAFLKLYAKMKQIQLEPMPIEILPTASKSPPKQSFQEILDELKKEKGV